MAGSTILDGQARKALVQQTSLSMTGSAGASFGVFDTVGLYSRICGIVSVVGSARLAYSMGPNSANLLVTSSFIINSGPGIVDFLNYGHAISLGLTMAVSQTGAKVFLFGEPIR